MVLGNNVVNEVGTESLVTVCSVAISLTSVDEIATEPVFIPDDQVKQVEKEACIKYDAELTTKVLKEEDNQPAVVPDIGKNFLSVGNVVDPSEN